MTAIQTKKHLNWKENSEERERDMTFIHPENDMALLSKHYLLLSFMCDINEVFKAVFINNGSVKMAAWLDSFLCSILILKSNMFLLKIQSLRIKTFCVNTRFRPCKIKFILGAMQEFVNKVRFRGNFKVRNLCYGTIRFEMNF